MSKEFITTPYGYGVPALRAAIGHTEASIPCRTGAAMSYTMTMALFLSMCINTLFVEGMLWAYELVYYLNYVTGSMKRIVVRSNLYPAPLQLTFMRSFADILSMPRALRVEV